MANFSGTVACNGIKLKPGVKEYLKGFRISSEGLTVGPDKDGYFDFYGYGWPNIYSANEEEDGDDDISDYFFDNLRKFVPKGEKLIIQMIGGEKCRFPLSAQEIVITSRRVTYSGFKC